MTLKQIVENSNYVTDEEITSANILGIANTCIAEVNRKCGTLLPFFTEDAINEDDTYDALPETWVFALCEPYYAYAIMANDGDTDSRDFHYNRFLKALEDFESKGMSQITKSKYKGNNKKRAAIDVSDVTVRWGGWI